MKIHSLREKEAQALSDEDYELAEMINMQMDEANVNTEQEVISAGLEVVMYCIVLFLQSSRCVYSGAHMD